jgi:hypothetical protein
MTNNRPLLMAFATDTPNVYNVWRYDVSPTTCVLWGVKANSRDEALEKGFKKLEEENE